MHQTSQLPFIKHSFDVKEYPKHFMLFFDLIFYINLKSIIGLTLG